MFDSVRRAPATEADARTTPVPRRRASPAPDGPAPRLGASLDAATSPTATPSPLISPDRGSRIVRRVPYLFNPDDRIYKETNHGNTEFASLGKFTFLGEAQVFVPYAGVHELRDLAEEIHRDLPKGGPIRNVDKKRKERKAAAEPVGTKPRRGRSLSTSKTGFGMNFGAEHRQVSDSMREETKKAERAEKATAQLTRRKRIHAAFQHIYGWYGEDDFVDVRSQVKLEQFANIVMFAIEKGPKLLPTGHGSRLPPAVGTLYSTPPRTRTEILSILGVEEKHRADFEDVAVVDLEPETYKAKRDELTAGGANMFRLEDATSGLWLFYTSDATAGRSSNSRIQVAGVSYTDAEFAAVDPMSDADLVRDLGTSFAQLRYDADSGWVDGRTMTISRGRDDGQAKAMKFWNALGAAAYANRFLGKAYDLNQNWEWLHIRGAQIGGQTVLGNLVPGFFTTNSAMIPYETMIKHWANDDPERFRARFQAVGGHGVFAATIRLSIKGIESYDPDIDEDRGHKVLGVMESPLLDFDPIGGRVVDRLAGVFSMRQVDQSVRMPAVPMDTSSH